MVGWMESANPLFVRALAAVFGGARECQRVQAGRMHQKGAIGQLEGSACWAGEGIQEHLWLCGRERGPVRTIGLEFSTFTPSFEELRERIGKSRLQQKGESESESFLGGKREDLDRA
jgi:hypothetical protein